MALIETLSSESAKEQLKRVMGKMESQLVNDFSIRPLRVLLVDDNESTTKMLSKYLQAPTRRSPMKYFVGNHVEV